MSNEWVSIKKSDLDGLTAKLKWQEITIIDMRKKIVYLNTIINGVRSYKTEASEVGAPKPNDKCEVDLK